MSFFYVLVDAELHGLQELGQADISLLRKSHLRDRLMVLRKALDKETKEKEAAANKTVRGSHAPGTRMLIIPTSRLLKLF